MSRRIAKVSKGEVTTRNKPAPWKCSRKAWCSSMQERLDDGYQKGLSQLELMNLKTGEMLPPVGIVFRKSAKDVGLMLNVCPWCAAPVLFKDRLTEKPKRKRAAKKGGAR